MIVRFRKETTAACTTWDEPQHRQQTTYLNGKLQVWVKIRWTFNTPFVCQTGWQLLSCTSSLPEMGRTESGPEGESVGEGSRRSQQATSADVVGYNRDGFLKYHSKGQSLSRTSRSWAAAWWVKTANGYLPRETPFSHQLFAIDTVKAELL